MKKIRINELARELEVKAHEILDRLPELGVSEKKTHSSSIDEDVAIKLRRLYGFDVPDLTPEEHDAEDHEPERLDEGPASEPPEIAYVPEVHRETPRPAESARVETPPKEPAPAAAPEKAAPVTHTAAPIRPPLAGRPIHPPVGGPHAPAKPEPPRAAPQAPAPPPPAAAPPSPASHAPASPGAPAHPAAPAPPSGSSGGSDRARAACRAGRQTDTRREWAPAAGPDSLRPAPAVSCRSTEGARPRPEPRSSVP